MLNENLMESVLNRDNIRQAYQQVKSNRGAPGVDGMEVDEFLDHARAHWPTIAAKLKTGHYSPGAIRSVSIPKPQGGQRQLGIPNVQDRVIQQALSQVLSPIFEAQFSAHSYGYRPGRSAHDAIKAAQGYVLEGKTWTVDIDISAFFDEVDHDRLMSKIGRTVRDRSVLKLIGRYLRAPMDDQGVRTKRVKGTPQGSPLSPLLANIYLNELDWELQRRGLSYCRYADDIVIYVGSERSGQRVLASISQWITRHLKLRINERKSGVGRPWNRQFLGFTFNREGKIGVAKASLNRLKEQVRRSWNAQLNLSLRERIVQWQHVIRGWWNYFSIAQDQKPIQALEGWIRRHMRKYFWQRWHNRAGRLNALRKLGVKPKYLAKGLGSSGAWRQARSRMMHQALNNARIKRWGLWVPSDFATL